MLSFHNKRNEKEFITIFFKVIIMKWETHFVRIVEADNFFDAVDKAKESTKDDEEVISVCQLIDEDMV